MNKLPYDVVLFDLDGTLTCSERGITRSARMTMEELGKPLPEDMDLRVMIGPPLYSTFRETFGLSDEETLNAITVYRRIHDEYGIHQYTLYPHIRELLGNLQDNGARVIIVTSKDEVPTRRVLSYFGLTHYFSDIVCGNATAKSRSKAELIRDALPERYERAAMVGDRKYDMEGARENGIDAIGAGYGYGSEEELMLAGATHYAPDTESLCALLCPGVPAPRGFFLTVEGLDGSGKTTQVDLLENTLRDFGYSVLRTREPGGCEISESIRRIILDPDNVDMSPTCEALLYAAARAQHVSQVIRPAVERGMLVLCDRFADSSVSYQGGGRELGVDAVLAINAPAVGDMQPDATVYLAVDHLIALSRRTSASSPDRLEMEASAFHERVQKAYERLIRENRKRFIVVDASGDIEDVAKDVRAQVLSRLEPDIRAEG